MEPSGNIGNGELWHYCSGFRNNFSSMSVLPGNKNIAVNNLDYVLPISATVTVEIADSNKLNAGQPEHTPEIATSSSISLEICTFRLP